MPAQRKGHLRGRLGDGTSTRTWYKRIGFAKSALWRVPRYVHIGESHRGYLGTGSVDFQGLFRGLAAIGYAGPLTFESFSSAVVSPSLSNTLCVWRNLCAAPPSLHAP